MNLSFLIVLVATSLLASESGESFDYDSSSYTDSSSYDESFEQPAPKSHRPPLMPSSQQGADDGPRLSGNSININSNEILPNPWTAVKDCVFKYPKTRFNGPHKDGTRRPVFFWDLENTIYLSNTVKVRKVDFLTDFLTKQMGITDQAEMKDLLTTRKEALDHMLECKHVSYVYPYDFIKPDSSVTEIVTNMKAQQWIFTNSSL